MEKVYLEEKIFYIENFISDEEAEKVLSMKLDWKNSRDNVHDNMLTASIIDNDDREYFIKTIEDKIRLVTDDGSQKFRTRAMLTKYLPVPEKCKCDRCIALGWKALPWHYENHPECDLESQWITLGIVLYFNDDYSGGELIFKNKPISIKPKKNTLMVFPASEEYTHAVTEVYDNERVVFAGFVYSNEYWGILRRYGLSIPQEK